jgi:hypothetical protein
VSAPAALLGAPRREGGVLERPPVALGSSEDTGSEEHPRALPSTPAMAAPKTQCLIRSSRFKPPLRPTVKGAAGGPSFVAWHARRVRDLLGPRKAATT